MRSDGRKNDELRSVKIISNYNKYAEGSALIEVGDTKVICTATIEDRVPPFLKGQGKGWVTAEYAMIPRATQSRNQRESMKGRPGGRTMEIQRMIGRVLRSVVDLEAIGERTVYMDCDVIQADGGTRTTSITGSFVAMALALNKLYEQGLIGTFPIVDFLASVSVGVVDGDLLLDLTYEEDFSARVDMNVVMTGNGQFVEIQGTGEESPFSREELQSLLSLAEGGIQTLIAIQNEILGPVAERIRERRENAVAK